MIFNLQIEISMYSAVRQVASWCVAVAGLRLSMSNPYPMFSDLEPPRRNCHPPSTPFKIVAGEFPSAGRPSREKRKNAIVLSLCTMFALSFFLFRYAACRFLNLAQSDFLITGWIAPTIAHGSPRNSEEYLSAYVLLILVFLPSMLPIHLP